MKNADNGQKAIPGGIYVIVIAAFIFFGYLMVRPFLNPREGPEDVVRGYMRALARGDCKGAYERVSNFTKEFNNNYRTIEEFNNNICTPVKNRYEKLYVYKIEGVTPGPEICEVEFRLRYKTPWMPRHRDKMMVFTLKYSDKRWKIENESLEI